MLHFKLLSNTFCCYFNEGKNMIEVISQVRAKNPKSDDPKYP